jgi:TolA-binding protein
VIAVDDAALIDLARQLPVALPSQTRREELRTAVLAARALQIVPRARQRVRAGMIAVGLFASAAGIAIALFPETPAAAPRMAAARPAPRVTVGTALPHARIVPTPPPLAIHGPPSPRRRIVARPPVIAAPVEQSAPAPAPADTAPAADELAYDAAWTALRAGELTRAASAFLRVQLIAPEGALADDAAYWQAVALARGGQRSEAIVTFRELLASRPRSPHTGAARAMLGWLIAADTPEEAARYFLAAVEDRDPDVRASARAGLAAIGHGDN